MVNFSLQKHNVLTMLSLRPLLLSVALWMLTCGLFAQVNTDYRGVWQVETPENGDLILIVKRNQLASYFRADNNDRTVYQGSWKRSADGIILKWADGSYHRITQNLFKHEITYFDALQNEQYTTSTVKLPEEILGQWAKAPSTPDEELSDRDRAKGFFGIWKTGPSSDPYYLIIEPDRSAATDWSQDNLSQQGLRGSWAKQGSELHITWDDGYYGILKQGASDVTFLMIPPGNEIEEATVEEFAAARVSKDQLSGDWYGLYTDERATQTGGIAFTNRKKAVVFYRGSWIVQRSENAFERIEISRFGGLKTSVDPTLHGSWRMSGQTIFMEWDDSIRRILSPVGSGFVLYEYKPGRPIDGVPTRVFPATPENTSKLAEYMQGRKAVATALLRRAEAAGVTADIVDAGWGQMFMRWAWPFDDTDPNNSSDALLKADAASLEGIDPWWWPFWSENPSAEKTDPETKRNTVKIAMPSQTAEPDPGATENPVETLTKAETDESKKSDWDWPF